MRKHTYITAILLLIIMCFIPTHGVFAANEATNSVTVDIVNILIKIASRARTIPAILAGKLMSNDFIYASGLGLDKTLFTMWNYMKNIANFTLGFLLVYKIAKSLFTKDAFSIKKELPNFLLASILLNMSWFLMGTLIDISNVVTAAVWSFPQALINESVIKSINYDKLNVSIPEKICANLDKWEQKCTETFNPAQRIDRVRARFNDMSWPLLYIGASIYRFQEYWLLNQDIKNIKDFTIGTIIKLLMLLMYIAPIIALFVINLKRVFYLWLWIIFSPVIVIWEVLKIDAIKKIWGKDKMFDISEILGMIFQPVFVIWGMAIVLILWVSMYSVIWWHPWSVNTTEQVSKVFGWAEIISAPSSSTFHNTTAWTEITFVWDVFKDVAGYAWWLVGYLIITTFVIMLLWAIVKMSTSGSKIASWTFDKITGLGKDLVTWMNIIPIGGNRVSLASMMNAGDGITRGINQKINLNKASATTNLENALWNSAFGKAWRKLYGDSFMKGEDRENDISRNEWATISNFALSATYLNDFIQKIAAQFNNDKDEKNITLKSESFKQTIFDNIKWNANFTKEIKEVLGIEPDKLTKESLFDGKSISSKRFLEYLQLNLSWKPTPLKDTHWNINIPTNFKIFSSSKKTQTPATPTPPTTT